MARGGEKCIVAAGKGIKSIEFYQYNVTISNRNGSAVILGGRSEDGSLQSDVWILSVNNSTGALIWERSIDLELSTGRCAHGATIVNRK